MKEVTQDVYFVYYNQRSKSPSLFQVFNAVKPRTPLDRGSPSLRANASRTAYLDIGLSSSVIAPFHALRELVKPRLQTPWQGYSGKCTTGCSGHSGKSPITCQSGVHVPARTDNVAKGNRNGCDHDRTSERGQDVLASRAFGKRPSKPCLPKSLAANQVFLGRRVHDRVSRTTCEATSFSPSSRDEAQLIAEFSSGRQLTCAITARFQPSGSI